MLTRTKTWRYLSKLGEEYIKELKEGYGTDLKNRSKRQIELVNEIVLESNQLLNGIAKHLKTKEYTKYVGCRSLKKDKYSIEDLVHIGSIAIIENMNKYDPEYPIIRFIYFYSRLRMYDSYSYQDMDTRETSVENLEDTMIKKLDQPKLKLCLDQELENLGIYDNLVLKMRFGLETEEELNCREIGDQFGLSRARIQQIKARALKNLRKECLREFI